MIYTAIRKALHKGRVEVSIESKERVRKGESDRKRWIQRRRKRCEMKKRKRDCYNEKWKAKYKNQGSMGAKI